MANISDVNDMAELVALKAQRAAQRVSKDIGAHIADMLKIIDCWPTGVDARLAGVDGLKLFQLAGQAVEQLERRGLCHGPPLSGRQLWGKRGRPVTQDHAAKSRPDLHSEQRPSRYQKQRITAVA